jgi:AAA family ATP:ADP antiporter
MSQGKLENFGRVRSFFWPIYRYELIKLLPMLLLFFLITLNYNILRILKDTLLITAKNSGAEVIPYVKMYFMLPMAVFMTYIFSVLNHKMRRERVFYVMIGIFLAYFTIFTFLIYPNRDALHPEAFANKLQAALPLGLKGFVAMIRYWTFTVFYAMAELWGTAILFVLFWGFANEITSINEAKRFYGLFGIGANFAGIAAGQLSVYILKGPWEQSFFVLMSIVIVSGFVSMFLYRWINQHILSDPKFYCPVKHKSSKTKISKKSKYSLFESLLYLFKSPYLRNITIIVLSYNMIINLVEVVWKHQVRELYPNQAEYAIYMANVMTVTGIIATVLAFFVSGKIRILGWTKTAFIAPMILLITSIGFFTFFFAKETMSGYALALLGTTPLAIVVFFGSLQNVLSRATKYTVFDATKEMAFIPLPSDEKIRGKAAIDGICSRIGKSGGSFTHQILLIMFTTVTACAPYLAVILFIVIFIWIAAVGKLGHMFNSLTVEGKDFLTVEEEAESKEKIVIETPLQAEKAEVI